MFDFFNIKFDNLSYFKKLLLSIKSLMMFSYIQSIVDGPKGKIRIRPCLVHPKTQNFSRFSITLNFAVHA